MLHVQAYAVSGQKYIVEFLAERKIRIMIVADIGNILVVGLGNKSKVLQQEVPANRLVVVDTAEGAVSKLLEGKVDVVICRWDLPDMPNGLLIERIIGAKPDVKTMAILRSGDFIQEFAARGLGVTVVVDEGIDDATFCEIVSQLCS